MQDRIPIQILNDQCWRRATFRSTGQPWERPQVGQEAEEQGRELGQTFVHWVPMFFAAIAVSFYIPRYCFQGSIHVKKVPFPFGHFIIFWENML